MGQLLTISDIGLKLIKAYEGYRSTERRLVSGQRVVGYGHPSDGVEGLTLSKSKAESLLKEDLAPIETLIHENIHTALTQGQFDALCSLAFNIGPKAFLSSEVVHALNNGRPLDAASAFDVWRKSRIDGRTYVIDALVRRRTAEKALFLRPEGRQVSASRLVLPPQEDKDLGTQTSETRLPVYPHEDSAQLVEDVPYELNEMLEIQTSAPTTASTLASLLEDEDAIEQEAVDESEVKNEDESEDILATLNEENTPSSAPVKTPFFRYKRTIIPAPEPIESVDLEETSSELVLTEADEANAESESEFNLELAKLLEAAETSETQTLLLNTENEVSENDLVETNSKSILENTGLTPRINYDSPLDLSELDLVEPEIAELEAFAVDSTDLVENALEEETDDSDLPPLPPSPIAEAAAEVSDQLDALFDGPSASDLDVEEEAAMSDIAHALTEAPETQTTDTTVQEDITLAISNLDEEPEVLEDHKDAESTSKAELKLVETNTDDGASANADESEDTIVETILPAETPSSDDSEALILADDITTSYVVDDTDGSSANNSVSDSDPLHTYDTLGDLEEGAVKDSSDKYIRRDALTKATEPSTGEGPYAVMMVLGLTLIGGFLVAILQGPQTLFGESGPLIATLGFMVGIMIFTASLYYFLRAVFRGRRQASFKD